MSGSNPQVRDVMTRSVEVAHLHETLDTTLDRMIAKRMSALPVVDGDRLAGLIGAAEIRSHAGEKSRVAVRDVAMMGAFHCFEHDSAVDAASTMKEFGVPYLIVLDADEKLVGVVTESEVARQPGGDAHPVEQHAGPKESEEDHPGLKVYSDRPKIKS